jgi:glutaredoxin 3
MRAAFDRERLRGAIAVPDHVRTADVTVFTQRFCGCCSDAKRLLRKKGVAFREVPSKESGGRAGLRSRFGPGAGTFPQIVINGRHVGGASDLAALEASGELDRLLAGATSQPIART